MVFAVFGLGVGLSIVSQLCDGPDGDRFGADRPDWTRLVAAKERVRTLAEARPRAGKLTWLGVGANDDGSPVIVATVTSPAAFADLPAAVDGFPVRVQKGAIAQALQRATLRY